MRISCDIIKIMQKMPQGYLKYSHFNRYSNKKTAHRIPYELRLSTERYENWVSLVEVLLSSKLHFTKKLLRNYKEGKK